MVQRFDREKTRNGYLRARMMSALTLLGAEESVHARNRWSYILLSEELRRVVAAPKEDAEELFKRMCFNALISNTDDHPRNHAFIAFENQWRLSPAYDITPSTSASHRRDLAMTCGSEGRLATAKNLLSQRSRFLLDEDQASKIISGMHALVSKNWYGSLKAQGVSERDAQTLKSAFAYDGFHS